MLQGRTAIITGSTSGIGLGIARALAAEGCALMLNGYGDAREIDRQRDDLATEFGVQVHHSKADVSKADECVELVADAQRRYGRVDVLVNNAGIQHVAPIEDFPADRWDAIIAVNLSSAFHTVRAALPGMRSRGWGRVVNIASTHGLVGSVNKAAYVAAKHGIVGLTKVVALETAGVGITCNAICPGWVLTPLVQRQIDSRARSEGITIAEAERALLVEKQPSARFTTVEQVGSLVVFLCSDAADNLTGASLPVDGGWVAQ
jgi:3-hydroxybutyrate dehydrogenase